MAHQPARADGGPTVHGMHCPPGGVNTESFKKLHIRGLEETDVAVARLVKTIDGLTMADTGRFLRPDGTDQPW